MPIGLCDVCICVHTCVWVRLLMHACMPGSQRLAEVSSFRLPALFSETESKVHHFLLDWLVLKSSRPLSPKPLTNTHQSWLFIWAPGIQIHILMPAQWTLYTEPSLQPYIFLIFELNTAWFKVHACTHRMYIYIYVHMFYKTQELCLFPSWMKCSLAGLDVFLCSAQGCGLKPASI